MRNYEDILVGRSTMLMYVFIFIVRFFVAWFSFVCLIICVFHIGKYHLL